MHRKSRLVSIGQLLMVQDISDWSCNIFVCIVLEESRTTCSSEGLRNMLGENGERIWEKNTHYHINNLFFESVILSR